MSAAEVARGERVKGVAAVSLVTLLWAFNFVAARPAAVRFDPFLLTFARGALALGVFVGLLAARGALEVLTWRNVRGALPHALACIVGNQVLFLLATRLTTPTHVALVIATLPVFVALLARFVTGERLAPLRWAGIAVAFLGVTLLALTRPGGGSKTPSLLGDGLALLAAAAFAIYTVASKSLVARHGAFPATTLLYAAGTLCMAPLAAWRLLAAGWPEGNRLELASALYLTVGATILAYPLFSYALARLTASRFAVFTYLQPLLAAGFSWSLGWERFSPATLLAATLTVLGVLLAQKRSAASLSYGVQNSTEVRRRRDLASVRRRRAGLLRRGRHPGQRRAALGPRVGLTRSSGP